MQDNQSSRQQPKLNLIQRIVKAVVELPFVAKHLSGHCELFYRQFDDQLQIEQEVPGLVHIASDGNIHMAMVPLEYDSQACSYAPGKAQTAALARLSRAGRISDETSDPTEADIVVVMAKAAASEKYRALTRGTVLTEERTQHI